MAPWSSSLQKMISHDCLWSPSSCSASSNTMNWCTQTFVGRGVTSIRRFFPGVCLCVVSACLLVLDKIKETLRDVVHSRTYLILYSMCSLYSVQFTVSACVHTLAILTCRVPLYCTTIFCTVHVLFWITTYTGTHGNGNSHLMKQHAAKNLGLDVEGKCQVTSINQKFQKLSQTTKILDILANFQEIVKFFIDCHSWTSKVAMWIHLRPK